MAAQHHVGFKVGKISDKIILRITMGTTIITWSEKQGNEERQEKRTVRLELNLELVSNRKERCQFDCFSVWTIIVSHGREGPADKAKQVGN